MSDFVRNCKELNQRQLQAIPVILQSKSITEGVEKVGVTRTTFYEWYRNHEFRAEFEKQRMEVIEIALHELKTSVSEAVNVLRELLQAEGEGVRLRTAQTILESVLKSIEIENIEKRVEALENSLKK